MSPVEQPCCAVVSTSSEVQLAAFTLTCIYLHCKACMNIQDWLQAKQSVTPAEGSLRWSSSRSAVRAPSNEHHVSDSFKLVLVETVFHLHHSSFTVNGCSCKTVFHFAMALEGMQQHTQQSAKRSLSCMTAHRRKCTANVAHEMHN